MKKTLVAAALLAAFGAASAQTSVTLSGSMDLGFIKATATPLAINRGDNSKLIFSASENLGGGLRAIANAQLRFDADTGLAGENGSSNPRPLFQGESRVGLEGSFGRVLLGRGLTAVQGPNGAYDSFAVTTVASQQGNLTARYLTDPTNLATRGSGRISNAVFYTSPNMGGLTVHATASTKERTGTYHSGGLLTLAPVPAYGLLSLSAIYAAGPLNVMVGYESNTVSTKFTQIGGTYDLGVAKLFGAYSSQKAGGTMTLVDGLNAKVTGYGIGATFPMGANAIKVGYAVSKGNNETIGNRGISAGYQINLSARTVIYTDIAKTRAQVSGVNTTALDLGIRHGF